MARLFRTDLTHSSAPLEIADKHGDMLDAIQACDADEAWEVALPRERATKTMPLDSTRSTSEALASNLEGGTTARTRS